MSGLPEPPGPVMIVVNFNDNPFGMISSSQLIPVFIVSYTIDLHLNSINSMIVILCDRIKLFTVSFHRHR